MSRSRTPRCLISASIAAIVGSILAGSASAAGGVDSRFDLANRCFAIKSLAGGDFIAAAGSDAYRADAADKRNAAAFYLKPSGLGTYLPYDEERKLPSVRDTGAVGRAGEPGPPTAWTARRARQGSFSLTLDRRGTAARRGPSKDLTLAGAEPMESRQRFGFVPARGCTPFPEATARCGGEAVQQDPTGRDGARRRRCSPPHHRRHAGGGTSDPRRELRPLRNHPGAGRRRATTTDPTAAST